MKSPAAIREFTGLAAMAEQLRDARAAGDQRAVAEEKMTAAEAVDRLRIATALAADWRSVADCTPRPVRVATDAEILLMLKQALPAAIARRDRAYKAMTANASAYRHYEITELWAVSDRYRFFSEGVQDDIVEYVRPYLNAHTTATALEAMLWWQQQSGADSIHLLTDATIALRELAGVKGEGRLAA